MGHAQRTSEVQVVTQSIVFTLAEFNCSVWFHNGTHVSNEEPERAGYNAFFQDKGFGSLLRGKVWVGVSLALSGYVLEEGKDAPSVSHIEIETIEKEKNARSNSTATVPR
jgi:hypothetical protein